MGYYSAVDSPGFYPTPREAPGLTHQMSRAYVPGRALLPTVQRAARLLIARQSIVGGNRC